MHPRYRSVSPPPEPTPLELPADLPVPDPYTKGGVVHIRGTPACGKSTLARFLEDHVRTTWPSCIIRFEASKDTLLRHAVARGLSYKVLRSDKTTSSLPCFLLVMLVSIPDPIRPKCLLRRHDNGRSTAQLPSGDPFGLAAGKVGQISAVLPKKTGKESRQDQRFSTQIYDWLVSPSQPFHLMLNFLSYRACPLWR